MLALARTSPAIIAHTIGATIPDSEEMCRWGFVCSAVSGPVRIANFDVVALSKRTRLDAEKNGFNGGKLEPSAHQNRKRLQLLTNYQL
jgi:hypothetical protein